MLGELRVVIATAKGRMAVPFSPSGIAIAAARRQGPWLRVAVVSVSGTVAGLGAASAEGQVVLTQ